MTMYTMNMNIYISKENEKWLRTEDSMSGLINRLLEEHYSGKVVKTPSAPTPEKINRLASKISVSYIRWIKSTVG